jgi:hypothetical protein
VGRFFIWCSGAQSDELDRAERSRYVTMGVLLVLVSVMGFVSMLVLTSYVLGDLTVFTRCLISVFWAMIIFWIDRTIATTVNLGGFFRGLLIYLPRLLLAATTAVLISEPITLKVFEKEITEQIDSNATATEQQVRERITAQNADRRAVIDKPVQQAEQSIESQREKAEQLRDEADREAEGERSSREVGCGDICKGLLEQAEESDQEARRLELTLPGLEATRKQERADLDRQVEDAVTAEVQETRDADGLLARHEALNDYLSGEPSALVIRWIISLLLLLFELSIVFFKLAGSAHDRTIKLRLLRVIELAQARAEALREVMDDFARRDVAADLELDLELAQATRERMRKRELGRITGVPWWTRVGQRLLSAGEEPASAPARGDGSESPTPPPKPGNEEPVTGDLIAGRYRLQDEVGRGGYGVVYRAVDERETGTVAVKIASVRLQDAWWNEVRFTSGNPRMAQLLKAGQVNDAYLYVVYPFYEPGSLHRYCTSGPGRNRQLFWCLEIINHVLTAIGEAHVADIVHGDIKPDNILLDSSDSDGTGRQVVARVADWGISQLIGDSLNLRRGHWRWTAVEILRSRGGHQISGELNDLYSIGAVLYWLISGQAPMEREMERAGLSKNAEGRLRAYATNLSPARLDKINPHIPKEVADLVQDWVRDDPVRRAGGGPAHEAALRALKQLRALKHQGRSRYERILLSHTLRTGTQQDIPRQPKRPKEQYGWGPDARGGDADPDATTPEQSA